MSSADTDQATVAVIALPSQFVARVSIGGAIDMAAEAALTDAVTRLATLAPRSVVVDLAAVTFSCSTLANFVVQIRNALPEAATLTLCRPTPMTRRLLHITGIDTIATVRSGLPTAHIGHSGVDASQPGRAAPAA